MLGPFQGKPACVRIAWGKGVCGAAAARRESVLVPDVHEFPGHIACDSASNSELVVPMIADGRVEGVLDLDSPLFGAFRRNRPRRLRAARRGLSRKPAALFGWGGVAAASLAGTAAQPGRDQREAVPESEQQDEAQRTGPDAGMRPDDLADHDIDIAGEAERQGQRGRGNQDAADPMHVGASPRRRRRCGDRRRAPSAASPTARQGRC